MAYSMDIMHEVQVSTMRPRQRARGQWHGRCTGFRDKTITHPIKFKNWCADQADHFRKAADVAHPSMRASAVPFNCITPPPLPTDRNGWQAR